MSLQPWQEDLAKAITEAWDRGERIILNVPRGSRRALTVEKIRDLVDLYDFLVEFPDAK